ncbi:MAG: efflux RND transporter permease subunit, partial [Myxococcota bacterium]
GNFESVEDLRRTVITLPGTTQVVYLEDIVDITRGYADPPRRKLRNTGISAVGVAISMRDDGNVITLGQKVNALLDRLPAQYPHGIDFQVIAFEPTKVDLKVDEFVGNVMQSVLIVLLAMLVALGLRIGLLVASLIPTTMVTTLMIMSFFDVGIDQISLAALIIALGMLVDNAIVMTESIMVQMRLGKSATEAAIESAAELRIPLLTSSLTTSAAFLPIYLAESAVGEYTNALFKVVTMALLSSWALSLTMIPLLCTLFLKAEVLQKGTSGLIGWIVSLFRRGKDKEGDGDDEAGIYDSPFYRGYRRLLTALLRFKYLTLAGALVVFVVAMMGFSLIPNIFFPKIAEPQFTAQLRMPLGTPIERTERMVVDVENFIRDNLMVGEGRANGVTDWAAFVGEGPPRFVLSYSPEPSSSEFSMFIINTNTAEVNREVIDTLNTYLFENYPDIDAKIEEQGAGPAVAYPIQIRISGKDTGQLFAIVEQVKAKLNEVPGPEGILDNWGARTKKLVVDINQASAFRAGVSNQDIAISLLTNLSGLETSQYREDDQVIPITLRAKADQRNDFGRLESMAVYVQSSGRNVPLGQVADTELAFEPSKVLRRDRLRTVTIQSLLRPGITAAEVNAQMIPWLDEQSESWGLGYRYEIGGEAESSGTANQSIAEKMPIAGFIILLLLVMQFNSLRRTFIILFTIPLALIGVVFGLLVAPSYFGFMTLLGVVSLAGIVINNAIVLLERIKLEIEVTGLDPRAAVIEASQRRLRPILLTTATTVGGLLPLWLGGGAMFEPMAIAILFGLLFSTMLTLGVVPTLYAILFRVSYSKSV